MSVADRLEALLRHDDFKRDVAAHKLLPERAARTEPAPPELDQRLSDALAGLGMARLYQHQATAIRWALAGKDVAVTTGTASGKTLCYNLPVLDARLRDREATALYLFPTKALTQDQIVAVDRLIEVVGGGIMAGTYDGDTPPQARRALREDGDIVATNPYMLHTGILPNHPKWVRFFAGLRYVVIDEMHGYTGVFGSHVANVMRRLRRIAAHYGAAPTFLLCSATLRNPGQLAFALVGREVELVLEDSSGRGEKHFVCINPPIVQHELGLRRNVLEEARRVVNWFAPHGAKTIVFGGSRNAVELLVKYLKDQYRLDGRDPERIRGYRGGYLPELRRTIERELREGTIDVVVSTNALELGIDIGQLDLCVMAGYPRSRASFFQQAGRAGRRASSSAMILVGRSTPLDQYVMNHSEYLLEGAPEAAAVDPDNLVIRANQMKCAAFELPFASGDTFGGEDTQEVLDFFATEAGILRKVGERYLWASRSFPAEEVSLDASEIDNVVIHEIETGRTLAEIDRPSAQLMVHDGAIYQHQGEQYQVVKLDWEGRRADLKRVDVDYYTEANVEVDVSVLTLDQEERVPSATAFMGDVMVRKIVTMFQKLRFYTREDVGTGPVHLPAEELDTDAFMLCIDEEFAAKVGLKRGGNSAALPGLAGLLKQVAPLFVKAAPSDFGTSTEIRSPRFECPTLYLFDDHPGGVGLVEQVFRGRAEVLRACLEVVLGCPCRSGCPSCVGPAKSGGAVKQTVLEILRELTGAERSG